jgi:hypothetical protein
MNVGLRWRLLLWSFHRERLSGFFVVARLAGAPAIGRAPTHSLPIADAVEIFRQEQGANVCFASIAEITGRKRNAHECRCVERGDAGCPALRSASV